MADEFITARFEPVPVRLGDRAKLIIETHNIADFTIYWRYAPQEVSNVEDGEHSFAFRPNFAGRYDIDIVGHDISGQEIKITASAMAYPAEVPVTGQRLPICNVYADKFPQFKRVGDRNTQFAIDVLPVCNSSMAEFRERQINSITADNAVITHREITGGGKDENGNTLKNGYCLYVTPLNEIDDDNFIVRLRLDYNEWECEPIKYNSTVVSPSHGYRRDTFTASLPREMNGLEVQVDPAIAQIVDRRRDSFDFVFLNDFADSDTHPYGRGLGIVPFAVPGHENTLCSVYIDRQADEANRTYIFTDAKRPALPKTGFTV